MHSLKVGWLLSLVQSTVQPALFWVHAQYLLGSQTESASRAQLRWLWPWALRMSEELRMRALLNNILGLLRLIVEVESAFVSVWFDDWTQIQRGIATFYT